MFIYQKFKQAEKMVLDRISMRQYYLEQVDSSANLDAVHINCPIHDDSTASARYFEETDTFYCYGCLHGGNVIVLHRFILKREIGEPDDGEGCKISYAYALRDLAKIYKIPIPNFFETTVSDRDVITPLKITTIDTGLNIISYKSAETKLDSLMMKLKKTNFNEFIKLTEIIDRYQSLELSKDMLGSVYLGLLRSYNNKSNQQKA